MFGHPFLTISSLVLALLLLGYWLWRENSKRTRRWQSLLEAPIAREITQYCLNHTLYFLAILGGIILLATTYELLLLRSAKTLELQGKILIEKDKAFLELAEQHKASTEQQSALQAEVEALKKSKPAEQPSEQEPSYSPPQTDQSELESLYSPEDSTAGKQADLDRIKKRYEELLVNNMFMHKCGKAQPSDIHIIISALSQEMASINAPGRLQYDILTSARGSFKEMYSQTPCDSAGTQALLEQYNKYIQTISASLNE